MEEVLQEILGEIRGMKSDIGDLKAGQVRLETRLDGVEEGQRRLETRLDGVEEGQRRLETRLDGVEEGQRRLDARLGGVEAEIGEVKTGQLRLEARMESEVIDKIRILFDAFQSHQERLDRHEERLQASRRRT
ncbi:MAG: hypothetical protein ACM309_02280 [Bacillota bacterium]